MSTVYDPETESRDRIQEGYKQRFDNPGSIDRKGTDSGSLKDREEAFMKSNTGKTAGRNEATGIKDALRSAEDKDDTLGKGFTGKYNKEKDKKGPKLPRNVIAKRWGAGMLIGLFMGGGGFGMAQVASGPLEFMHFGQLLTKMHMGGDQDFMDGRAGRLIRFMRGVPDQAERRNLGFLGNKFADHYDKKLRAAGMTPEYENGRLRRIVIDTTTPEGRTARQNMLDAGTPNAAVAPDANGRVVIDFDLGVGSSAPRVRAVQSMIGGLGLNRLSSAMATRLQGARSGLSMHRLSIANPIRDAIETLDDKVKRVIKEKIDYRRNGVAAPNTRTSVGNNENPDDPNSENDNNRANQAAGEANDLANDATDPNASVEQRSAKIRAKLTSGVGITGAIAMICGMQALGNAVGDLRYTNMILPLMRTAMDVITMGAQLMAGMDIDPEAVGILHDDLYDEKTKTSWIDSLSMQMELNDSRKNGEDMPEGSKPGNNEKPAFFKTIDSIINAIPGFSGFCGLVSSTAGGLILSAVGIAASATGPFAAAFAVAMEAAQYGLGAAFMDDLVRWIAGEQIAMDAAGALLGNYGNYGARLIANDVSISHGGRALDLAQEKEVGLYRDMIDKEENRNKSFYARYFDLKNVDSAASKLAFQTPIVNKTMHDPGTTMASLSQAPIGLFSSIINSFSSIFVPQASAASTRYNYGFAAYGFPMEQTESTIYENPYANAEIVEPQLEHLNEEYGTPCFNTTIDPETFKLQGGTASKRYDQIEDKCNDFNNADLNRFSFYLADMTTAKTMACHEGIDVDACNEIGFGATSAAGTQTAASATIDMEHLYDESVSVACAPGTTDAGEADGYHDEKKVRIRLCQIPLIKDTGDVSTNPSWGVAAANGTALVNSRVSGAYLALAQAGLDHTDARGPAPIVLKANSSFRTMKKQEQLWNANPNPALVAKPGTSNHQMGLAIDFGRPGSETAIQGGDQWFRFLTTMSKTSGIFNYPRESWHWSPTGT